MRHLRTKLKGCIAGILLSFQIASAETVFEREFKNAKGEYFDLNSPGEIQKHADFSFPIPFSRSPDSSDLGDPRVVYAMGLENSTFLGFSGKDGHVQAISWDPVSGRFEFFDKAPGQKPMRANRRACLVCHQNGGPIFPRKPWSEFGEGVEDNRILAALCEKHPSGQFRDYRFASRCVCSESGHCHPEGTFLNSGGLFQVDPLLRLTNQKTRARVFCQKVCGDDGSELSLDCRKALLQIALRNPEIFTDDTHFDSRDLTEVHLKKVQRASGVSELSSDPESDGLLEKISMAAKKFWPKDGFSIKSSVLPDRDPLANAIRRVTDSSGRENLSESLSSDVDPDSGDEQAEGAIFEKFGARESVVRYGPSASDYRGSIADPAMDRKELINVDRLSPADAKAFAFRGAFDCLGFRKSDEEEIQACKNRMLDPDGSRIIASSPIQAVVAGLSLSWPLSSVMNQSKFASDAIRIRIMNAVRTTCGIQKQEAETCETLETSPIDLSRSPIQGALVSAERVLDPCDKKATLLRMNQAFRKTVKPYLQRCCFDCHSSGRTKSLEGRIVGDIMEYVTGERTRARNSLELKGDFPFKSVRNHLPQSTYVSGILSAVTGRMMPPGRYTEFHHSCRLEDSKDEVKGLEDWAKQVIPSLTCIEEQESPTSTSLTSTEPSTRAASLLLKQECLSCHRTGGVANRYSFLNSKGDFDVDIVKALHVGKSSFLDQAIIDLRSGHMPPGSTPKESSPMADVLFEFQNGAHLKSQGDSEIRH